MNYILIIKTLVTIDNIFQLQQGKKNKKTHQKK